MSDSPKSHLAELVRVQVRQLEDRIEAQYADLRERIEDLRRAGDDLAAAMLARIDAHEEYHRANEHRWGLVKLAGRYPFRFAALTGAAIITLLTARPDSATWLAEMISRLAGFR